MKLGVVFPIANGAQILSEESEHLLPHFSLQRELALKAEDFGFDYGFSQVTLRGFGGSTEHWDYQIDSLTLMAGLGSITSTLRLIGSVAIPTLHPAMAAKMTAGVAEVSGGRFDLNLVTGWNKPQYAQMGLWPGDDYFGTRYEYGEEYATILRELWDTGRSDFSGKFYNLEDCQLGLMPEGRINLICAGQSDRGLDFTARYGDTSYILGTGNGVEGVAEVVSRVESACERAERSVEILLVVLVVLAENDEEAEAKVDRFVDNPDRGAIANMVGDASLDAGGATAGKLTDVSNAVFQNLEKIVGGPETVARYFDELAEVRNLSGVIIVFDEAVAGLELFGREVMPRMRSRSATVVNAPS